MASGEVIFPSEAEAIVESLRRFDVKDIGGKKWARQHEYIEKLNIQSVVSASASGDEFVKDFLLTHEKMPLLVEDLILTEVWKDKVFPQIGQLNFQPKFTFPIYIILYHEAVIVNLLETLLFHKECTEAVEDLALDLIDYTYRKLTAYISTQSEEQSDETEKSSGKPDSTNTMEELVSQSTAMNFDIIVKCVSILHYAIDHLDNLPLSVMTRLLNTYDTPILLLNLVEHPPWSKRVDGKLSKYIDNKWREVSIEDSFRLTKTEGQVWIALFQLLMNQNCQQKYELNNYRKNSLLKLRSYLNDVLLDQMPMLGDLQRYLEQLSIMDPPATTKDLILEQLPEIRENVLQANKGKWRKIAEKQIKTFFSCDEDMKEQARRWAETYSNSVVDELVSEPPKCSTCGGAATKRCSRCGSEWYCCRECQVKNWPKHKKVCDLMKENVNKLKEQTLS